MAMIPSRTDCYRLFHQTGMLMNIAVHSIQVCRVSLLLADALTPRHPALNRPMIRAGALLHDITKTRSLTTGERHADTGAEFLKTLGYAPVADIVRQHVRLDAYETGPPVTEAEIVNYADKRVLHDRIAPLQDRMDYIMDRYGADGDIRRRISRIWEKTRGLEEKLFQGVPFRPEEIAGRLPDDGRGRAVADYLATGGDAPPIEAMPVENPNRVDAATEE